MKDPDPLELPLSEEQARGPVALALRCFEEAWQLQAFPRVEHFLPLGGPVRLPVLAALVESDLCHRWLAGHPVNVEYYLASHPELSAQLSAVIRLIEAEFQQRWHRREAVTFREYFLRFPRYSLQLTRWAQAHSFRPPETPAGGALVSSEADLAGSSLTRSQASNDGVAGPHRFSACVGEAPSSVSPSEPANPEPANQVETRSVVCRAPAELASEGNWTQGKRAVSDSPGPSADADIACHSQDQPQDLVGPTLSRVDNAVQSPVTRMPEERDSPYAPGGSALVAVNGMPPNDGVPAPLTRSHQEVGKQGTADEPDPVPESEPDDPTLPTIQGYEVLGLLGHGGMGVVYKARQIGLKRLVALKMILSGPHFHGRLRARFQGEAEAVARLQHPNIVQIYDVGEDGGRPYITFEYVAGGSLDKRLRRKPLSARQVAPLVETLARAIHEAHRANIIHRDLKPANILLAGGEHTSLEQCIPKITDFGLAKQFEDHIEEVTGPTGSQAILGTPPYMSPEQAAGRKHDVGPASDVYALGALLYECLTGRPPFLGSTPVVTLDMVVNADPVPPRRLQPDVPRDLETICLKCLRKEIGKRYRSGEELAEDLRRFRIGEPIKGRRVSSFERAAKWVRRRPTSAALAAVLLSVAVALPAVGLRIAAETNRRERAEKQRLDDARQVEEQRLDDARAEVQDLLGRGQTAALSKDWKSAEDYLDKALKKADSDLSLDDLRGEVRAALDPVKARLAALDIYRAFVRDRDDALFYATLATGEGFQANRVISQNKARAALTGIGFISKGGGKLQLRAAFTAEEKQDLIAGAYALLLALAESEARRLPRQTVEDHHQSLEQALALLDRADTLGVRTRAIYLRRARYLGLLKNEEGARTQKKKALDLAARTDLDPQDHFLVGQEFYSQCDLDLANQEFRHALQLDGRHFWTHYFLGMCCITSGKADAAVAHLTLCQSQRADLIWVYLLRGFALGQTNDYAAAEADFARALTLEPSEAARYVLFNNRGVMRVGRPEARAGGLKDLQEAIKLRPDQHEAYASLAEAHRLGGRPHDALSQLNNAIRVAQRQIETEDLRPAAVAQLHHSRARLHLTMSNRNAALGDLEMVGRLAKDDRQLLARAQIDRGRVLHLQGRFEEAIAAYDASLQAHAGRVDAHRRRGEVLLAQRKFKEAAAAFDAYVDRGGSPSVALFRQRGLARSQLGRHTEALDDYSRALDAGPKPEERSALHLYRGQEHLAVNAPLSAQRDFEETVRLDPGNSDAHIGLALVRVKQGDHVADALEEADRALTANPQESRLWHGVARVYSLAATAVSSEVGQDDSQARVRLHYQQRALQLLGTALDRVPREKRRDYWRDNVETDAALYPLRRHPGFIRLANYYLAFRP